MVFVSNLSGINSDVLVLLCCGKLGTFRSGRFSLLFFGGLPQNESPSVRFISLLPAAMNSDGFPNTFDERASDESTSEDVIADGPVAGPSVAPSTNTSAPSFRFAGKRGFFTFPQFDMDPAAALVKFLAWRPLERAMVCREAHADGAKHLHVLFWCKTRVDLRTCRSLDAILGKHGNYQVMKDPVASVKYLMKEKDFVSFGFDPVEYVAAAMAKRARTHKWDTVVDLVQSGGSLTKFEDQAFIARNLRSLLAYASWWKTHNPVHRVAGADGSRWRVRVVVLWGPTGLGKTRWATDGAGIRGDVFVLPAQRPGGVWWDGYLGERVLLLDDFDPAKMSILTLFRVLDSYKFVGMIKGASVTADWLEVIITNNCHPHDWYPQANYARQSALSRRIKICYVGDTSFRTRTFEDLFGDAAWPEDDASSANLVE